jgi:hypothetical protein
MHFEVLVGLNDFLKRAGFSVIDMHGILPQATKLRQKG